MSDYAEINIFGKKFTGWPARLIALAVLGLIWTAGYVAGLRS